MARVVEILRAGTIWVQENIGATMEIAVRDEVLEDLRQASQRRAFLVQPRLVNHREIADLLAMAPWPRSG